MQPWRGLFVLLLLVALAACGGDDAGDAASGGDAASNGEGAASVSFAEPDDGATVDSPVHVEFEAEGIEIEEAGAVNEGAGHFHVMVDTPCVGEGETIPNDDAHLHFGDASEEAELELEPGEHTLCLQVGDGAHNALSPTDEITITVE